MIKPMRIGEKFTVELTEDVATGEVLLPIPEAILNANGWFEGTELEILIEGDDLIIKEYES